VPIWEALPEDLRGEFFCNARSGWVLRGHGIRPRVGHPGRGTRLVVVAGHTDIQLSRRRRHVLVEHGAGQSYGDGHPGYSGGHDRDSVVLFLCPNEVVAERNRQAYPATPSEVVGSPRVEALCAIERIRPGRPTVALSFHWPCRLSRECGWALPHYEHELPVVVEGLRARGIEVIGHGHPRARQHFAALWRTLGVEHVVDFDDVVAQADVYVADNSSTLFEWAALDRPVVVLNAPWYRRDLELWPRFWACAGVGLQVEHPHQLLEDILRAAGDPYELRVARLRAVSEVFPMVEGSAERAAHAIATAAASVP